MMMELAYLSKLLKWVKQVVLAGSVLIVLGLLAILLINLWVIASSWPQRESIESYLSKDYQEAPAIVLGAGVINNEEPSQVLKLRLDKAIELYQAHPQQIFIMSGDHREANYNEVAVMKQYMVNRGVPSDQIYLDHLGLSTLASVYRANHIFNLDRVVLITQPYHLSRALLLARDQGIEAIGIAAEETSSTRFQREFREVLARVKDFAVAYLRYPAEPVSDRYEFNLEEIDGNQTNHKNQFSD